ncbi:MAG TPA: trehalose-6-phosphate synthase [Gaiellaceae bacterium]
MLPLVAYANRLPVQKARGEWQISSGGLVTALRPTLSGRDGVWVGWNGGASDMPRRLPELDVELDPVDLTRREVADYYHGFANRTLWPLLHGLVQQPVFDRSWWRAYRVVNERFAAAGGNRPALRWVHDYQLMLVPALLRARGAQGPIGFFLHIPWTAPEIFARLPWRREILDGLLGADVVSFHTEEYRDDFVRTCVALADAEALGDGRLRTVDGRVVQTAAHPISIDAADYDERARSGSTSRRAARLRDQFAGRRLLLGVDRLDYTKGILERLQSYELLLELRPELRASTALLQVAVPSRGEIPEYRELRANVEQSVGRINGRFTEPGGDVPVHYLHRGVPPDRLLAYYRTADVCLVTPLRDGMNLVAKEFVVAQAAAGGAGALVLSEFTGAAGELAGEALLCNPFDLEGLAATIELALSLDEDDRRARIERMARHVHENDVFAWAGRELDLLATVSQT